MLINDATPDDLAPAVGCLAAAFAHDPITGYLLHHGPGYPERVTQFLALLMRARLALHMPVLVARQGGEIHTLDLSDPLELERRTGQSGVAEKASRPADRA